MTPPPFLALSVFLGCVALQRLAELSLSARNARALARRGGVLVAEPGFGWFVALHVGVWVAVVIEVLVLGARPGRMWPVWLAVFGGAQLLRYAAIRTLGDRWNVRIWVVPGAQPIRSGPYRFLRHPNYLAVAIELITGPLLFGAWRSALVASVLNLWLLRRRIRAEETALTEAAATS